MGDGGVGDGGVGDGGGGGLVGSPSGTIFTLQTKIIIRLV